MSIVGRREKIFHIFDTAPTKGENNRVRERDNFIYCTLRERERESEVLYPVGGEEERVNWKNRAWVHKFW